MKINKLGFIKNLKLILGKIPVRWKGKTTDQDKTLIIQVSDKEFESGICSKKGLNSEDKSPIKK